MSSEISAQRALFLHRAEIIDEVIEILPLIGIELTSARRMVLEARASAMRATAHSFAVQIEADEYEALYGANHQRPATPHPAAPPPADQSGDEGAT